MWYFVGGYFGRHFQRLRGGLCWSGRLRPRPSSNSVGCSVISKRDTTQRQDLYLLHDILTLLLSLQHNKIWSVGLSTPWLVEKPRLRISYFTLRLVTKYHQQLPELPMQFSSKGLSKRGGGQIFRTIPYRRKWTVQLCNLKLKWFLNRSPSQGDNDLVFSQRS